MEMSIPIGYNVNLSGIIAAACAPDQYGSGHVAMLYKQ